LRLIADTTTTSSLPAITHLTGIDGTLVLWLTVGLVIAAGVVVAASRYFLEGSGKNAGSDTPPRSKDATPPDRTVVRSWLAISLAGGLLLFCAVSFGLDDTTLRSTLIGGLVANAGAAAAFYFASKSSDQARKDILNASLPAITIPNLIGKDEAGVNATVASMPLHVDHQPQTRKSDASVVKQSPPANQTAPVGSQVTVTFAGPIPNLTSPALSPNDADTALKAVNLNLVASPSKPGDATKATTQSPTPGQDPPSDQNVHVDFA